MVEMNIFTVRDKSKQSTLNDRPMDIDKQIFDWEQAKDIFEKFTVFMDEPEMRWFEKVWKSFIKNGLASYANEIDKYWVLARITTIGIMFNEFCNKAWDERFDEDTLLMELFWELEGKINRVILGNMVEPNWLSKDAVLTEQDSFIDAMSCLVYKSRVDVFNALCKVFGGSSELFVSLWLSPEANIEVSHYPDDLLDSVLNVNLTGNKMKTFDYVNNGMFAPDA